MISVLSCFQKAISRTHWETVGMRSPAIAGVHQIFTLTVLAGIIALLFSFERPASGAISLAGDDWSNDGVPTLIYEAEDGRFGVQLEQLNLSTLEIRSDITLFRSPFPIVSPPSVISETLYVYVSLTGQLDTLVLPYGVIGLGRGDLSQAVTARGSQFPFGKIVNFNLNYIPLRGDFDLSGSLSLSDLGLLSTAIVGGSSEPQWDLDRDGRVNPADGTFWVTGLQRTWVGDANLNGAFDTEDLVQVFAAGTYEDSALKNSNWQTGDWDWDGEFTASDLIVAFQDGGYNQGPRVSALAVPEPRSSCLIATSLFGAVYGRRWWRWQQRRI